jgi:hypothetical protein
MRALQKIGILSLGMWLLLSSTLDEGGAFDAQVNTIKQQCKELIKNTRYEGSKTTYYNLSNSKQLKAVELFMFMAKEYQFAIGAKKCSVPLTVRIYDAAADVEERTLIKEYKNVQGKNFMISSNELNKIYRKKVPEVERLKNVRIEYAIGTGKGGREAIVLVFGHKA